MRAAQFGVSLTAVPHSVSILCHTLSGNAFGRAHVLAQLLRDDFDVEIVAACRPGDLVWAPVRGRCEFPIRRWTPWSYPGYLAHAPSIARTLVGGEVIYAVKPHLSSLGLGLTARRVLGRPLIADVDDWELGFSSLSRDIALAPWALLSAASALHTRRMSAAVRRADAVTVSNTFLYERYGGAWIPHARAEHPALATVSSHGLPTVVFAGTPRRHKGLRDLLAAFDALKRPAQLRIIGGTLDPSLVEQVAARKNPRISIEPPVPMDALFGILASADVIVIPQSDSPASRGQLPAKLLDAMSVGKAIVSTAVGDIPRWLADGAGVVVPPGDVHALGGAIDELLADPPRRTQLGERARERFREYGTPEIVRPRLVAVVRRALTGEPMADWPAPFADH